MMLYKPLFSLAMAFAAASSVAASTTPVRRGGGGLPIYGPSPISPIAAGKCEQKDIQCCNTVTSQSDPQINNILGSVGILNDVNPDFAVGQGCVPILSSGTCNNQALCCDRNSQNSAIALNCVPVNLSL